LFIFVVSGIVLFYLVSYKLLVPVLIVFPVALICFGAAIKYHNQTAFLKKHTAFLKEINEAEILREKCHLEQFDTGQKFIDPNHPYSSDLDIFGQHSLFQLLNRTTTESGMIRLAEWLTEPAPHTEIPARQQAIEELAQKPDWRQDFQATGMHHQNRESDYKKLLEWAEAPVVLLKRRIRYIVTAIVFSVLSLLALWFSIIKLGATNWYIYLLSLFAVLFIISRILKKLKPIADDIVETSQKNSDTLKGYRSLIRKIEGESFQSEKLCKIQSILKKSNYSAFNEINKLCKLLDFSQQRGVSKLKMPIKGNAFYGILNSFLLLDIYLIIGTEQWKAKNSAHLKFWAEAVSEFEAINSVAGFCYSNPAYTFPVITEKSNYVHFELLGHPLINSEKRVCNDFNSEGHGNIVMITGSNMAGKSTFLRAAGVNLMLALAGAPCCAKSGSVGNLKLFSSMRTHDNLEKGISSFYAELSRIEKLLKLINNNRNVFFLLDEMFKGTNSKDRHKGGFSLINQLSRLETSGMIATHDIDLAKLAENKKLVTNYSFNSEIKNGSMHFSYQLQPGICNDFNASELMKKSGINILQDIKDERN
jgi:DNA mismatch repair ATPase MutS